MNDRFVSLQLFVRVARAGGFAVAAREMGISQPTASRMVAALEQKVGVRLLTRTTRAVSLTEAGTEYLARAEAILAALDEADHAARGTGELRGLLRVATSPSFARRCVIPRLARFADEHPALRIEITVRDERQDLVGDAIDVALRVGKLTESSAVARKVGTVHRVLVASPSYLARAPAPRSPSDLAHHTIIVGPAARGSDAWTFTRRSQTSTVRVEGRFILDGGEPATAAAVAGLGILSGGDLGMLAELESGELVRVLPGWDMGSVDISVILPAGRAAKPSAKAFADFIAGEMKDADALRARVRTKKRD